MGDAQAEPLEPAASQQAGLLAVAWCGAEGTRFGPRMDADDGIATAFDAAKAASVHAADY